jgi:hypothetical protein
MEAISRPAPCVGTYILPAMPLPVINGVVRCAVRGLVPSGSQWTNVHHMEYALGASTPGTAEITAMHALLGRLYTGAAFGAGAAWLPTCAPATTVFQVDYTILNGSALGLTLALAGAGATANSAPSEVAHVMTLGTTNRGRRYRGRLYLPCVSVSSLTAAGQLAQSKIDSGVAQYLGMIAALAGIQWRPVVASYGHGSTNGVPTTWTPFATPIVSVRIDPAPDVQRRRKI